jgi:hypothetical protein
VSVPATIGDYHVHTQLCGHAEGEPAAYVERAVELARAAGYAATLRLSDRGSVALP